MQKIPTMFVRDETINGHPVTNQIKPECQWVLDGEGVATRKIDGTNVKIERGELFKRQKPRDRDYDEAAYVPCDRSNPADRWAFEAFDAMDWKAEGIYELVGPKVQSNPEKRERHELVHVVPWDSSLRLGDLDLTARTFDALRGYLSVQPIEGIVFHHPDGRMAKIKRRDFGLKWPA
jgi:hypothetical protein